MMNHPVARATLLAALGSGAVLIVTVGFQWAWRGAGLVLAIGLFVLAWHELGKIREDFFPVEAPQLKYWQDKDIRAFLEQAYKRQDFSQTNARNGLLPSRKKYSGELFNELIVTPLIDAGIASRTNDKLNWKNFTYDEAIARYELTYSKQTITTSVISRSGN